jgi:hypothetical protein
MKTTPKKSRKKVLDGVFGWIRLREDIEQRSSNHRFPAKGPQK